MKVGSEQKKQFNEIYDYVRYELLKYDKGMKLPNSFIYRLYGIACGRHSYRAPNKKIEEDMPIVYPFPIILATLIKCKAKILHSFKTYAFNDENHRINYIFKVIEENINGTKMEYDRRQKEKEKLDNVDAERLSREVQSYNKQTELKEKFKELL